MTLGYGHSERAAEDGVSKGAPKRKRDETKESVGGVAEELSLSEKRQEWFKEKTSIFVPTVRSSTPNVRHQLLEKAV